MAERSFRTEGIILKRRIFGEADRLLTVLSPARGKFDAIAKGARKPASTKTGHVELFTKVDLLVHKGRDLDIAVQAEMIEPYLALREDLQRGAFASYVVELLDRFTYEGEETSAALYELLGSTLARLCADPDPQLVVRYYEIRLLDIAGFRPELFHCVISRQAIEPEDQYFSYAEGGVVRPAYARMSSDTLVPVTMVALKMLRHMQRSPYAQVRSLTIPPALHAELERIMLGYMTYLLERKLQSVDFIQRIRRAAQ